MTSEKIAYPPQFFPELFLQYIKKEDVLKQFYGHYPDLKGFAKQIQEKQFSSAIRKDLHTVLVEQYKSLPKHAAVDTNLQLLQEENTITVTTGHQLNLFTGPLYLIYKLLTAIRLAEALKAEFPEKNFVPVYWMATEDHDFAEINHFYLFGKKNTWEQETKTGTGRISTKEMTEWLDALPAELQVYTKHYREQSNLANATRSLVHELIGKYGIVVLDADDARLKKHFIKVMSADLFTNVPYEIVADTTLKLKDYGYNTQINAREINLFYLTDNSRTRIVREGDVFKALDTVYTWEEDVLQLELAVHPERFSPNVVLRPVYQETILPNLVYIGGPAEVAYWLQLKNLFKEFKLAFPLLMPRFTAQYIPAASAKKWTQCGLSFEQLFGSKDDIKKSILSQTEATNISTEAELELINNAFTLIEEKANKLDGSLQGFIRAEQNKVVKQFADIQKRLQKAAEGKEAIRITQAENLVDKLLPGGGLQERKESPFTFLLNQTSFVEELYEVVTPLDYRFTILS